MQIKVNGKTYEVQDHRTDEYLLDYLREDLDLTGTKNGCNVGVCGACVVLVNDKPVRSCRQKISKCADTEITTIEGLGTQDNLHPLQQSFLDAGAVQCGFCIPGMLLSSHALLLQNQNPTRDDIRKAINNNLCRCTGYVQIVDAVENAATHYSKND